MIKRAIAIAIPFMLFIGCANLHKTQRLTALNPELSVIEIPHSGSATPIRRKRDTLKNLQKFIDSQYQLNFNRYFLPKFNQLSGVIDKQAVSINNLSTTIINMRARSIKTRDSLQRVSNYYQQQVVEMQKTNFQEAKKRSLENQKQIKQLNKITQYLIAGFLTLLIMVIITFVIVMFMNRRLKLLQKSLNYE